MISRTCTEAVVLLHGLGCNRFVMAKLARTIQAHGYLTANWGYRSILGSIESLAYALNERLNEFNATGRFDRVHLVAHSMGGIIARRAFTLSRPRNLGRFVMVSPPNAGSHIARIFAPSLSWLCPPLRELSDLPHSYVNRLHEPVGIDVGIIAAAKDRVVKLASTFLACQRDHIVLPGHHAMLLWHHDTAAQSIHFLQHGRFDHHDGNAQRQSSSMDNFV